MKQLLLVIMSFTAILTSAQHEIDKNKISDAFVVIQPVTPPLQWLSFGEIKPEGWIKNQMEKDMAGFTGRLDELVPDLMDDKIYGAERLTKDVKTKNVGNITDGFDPQYLWWNSETQSNWRDAYIRNAILLNDTNHLARAGKYIDYLLSTQDDDGYLGIYATDLRYRFTDENGELWAKTTALRGVLAWYEYTGKQEILDAIERAVKDVLKHYPVNASSPFKSTKPFAGGLTHGLVFTDILDRLFQLTGNQDYLNYALFLYRDFSGNILAEDAQFSKILDTTYRNKEHGVHTYEHLRPLAMAWVASGNEQLKAALDNYLEKIRQCTTPAGGPIGDEWVGGRHAHATETGYEYCSLQELLDGYNNLLQKTGESRFGDLTERLFFNAAQGARHPEESAIAYCKTDNSFAMTGTKNGEPAGKEIQTRFKYSPAHQDVAVCCAPNAGRITPYFVKSMWMKDKEGLVSALHGPCLVQTDINGVKVHVSEETDYPFGNSINYRISVEKPVHFKLKIRKPEWAENIRLNCSFKEVDGFIVISKKWKGEETIQLEFIAEPELKQDQHKENYFTFGALVFALPVKNREIVSKTHPVKGFRDLEYEPVDHVNYRLPVSEKHEMSVNTSDTSGNLWNGIKLNTSLINESTGISEEVNLLPLGTTILRQVTFINEVQTASGTIKRFRNFQSNYVDARNIDIWLPDGYDAKKKYAVLYMHDGQMLFDSTINWNKQEWGMDETAGRLITDNKIKDCIVVGIWNTSKRHSEYFPQKPFQLLSQEQKDKVNRELQDLGRTTETFQPVSDNYLKFIVEELKPFIDRTFSTRPDRNNTFISGSSMGGLISMYAICEYPRVFGGAACLSTHWPGTFTMENNMVPDAFISYLEANLPDPETHKIYFDYGDQTLDALYPPLQKKADEVMIAKGFTKSNWETRFFPGEDHSEISWGRRLDNPMTFLLKK
ncbi:MAG: alpha/beta hydrolase-fold protein [Lentimicrobium sp.]